MNTLYHLENALGPAKRSSSGEHLFLCPFCYHHKPKLSINLGSKIGYWKCWVCGEGGKKLSSLLYKIGLPFDERKTILNDLGESAHLDKSEEDSETPLRLPAEYRPFWNPQSHQHTFEYTHALNFLIKRGLTREDILKHQIGYCFSGKYGSRIIIPSFGFDNNLNYFVSRTYFGHTMKYLNPPTSKNNIIFEQMIDWQQPIVLVEGVFDAITLRRNAVPLLGKILYTKLKQRLLRQKPPMVYVMLDNDAKKEAMQIDNWLRINGIQSKVVNMFDGKDASEIGYESAWDLIYNSEKTKFVDLVSSKF
ncbi:MAG: hypothetical protein VW683_00400 [Betaproteobacteria bacterium]|jgi:DNA primase